LKKIKTYRLVGNGLKYLVFGLFCLFFLTEMVQGQTNLNGSFLEKFPDEAQKLDSLTLVPDASLDVPLRIRDQENRQTNLFYLITGLVLLIGLLRWFFSDYMRMALSSALNIRELEQINEEPSVSSALPSVLLWFISKFVLSLLLFFLVIYWSPVSIEYSLNLFFWCLLGVIVYFFLKEVVYRFIQYLILDKKFLPLYLLNGQMLQIIQILTLLPIVILLAFNSLVPKSILLMIGLSLFFVFLIIQYIQGVRIGYSEIKGSPIHFFLYFCTLEIAPLLIFIKLSGFWQGL